MYRIAPTRNRLNRERYISFLSYLNLKHQVANKTN